MPGDEVGFRKCNGKGSCGYQWTWACRNACYRCGKAFDGPEPRAPPPPKGVWATAQPGWKVASRTRAKQQRVESHVEHVQKQIAPVSNTDAMRLLAELKRVDGLAESAEIAALEAKAQAVRQAAKDAMPLSKQAGILEKKISWKEGTRNNAAEKVAQAKAAVEEANATLQKANGELEARSTELQALQTELAALRKREQEPPTDSVAPSDALNVLTAALASISAGPEVLSAMEAVKRTVEAASAITAASTGLAQQDLLFDDMQIDEILAEDEVAEAFELAAVSGAGMLGGADSTAGCVAQDVDAGATACRTELHAKRRKAISLVAQKIAKSRRQCG